MEVLLSYAGQAAYQFLRKNGRARRRRNLTTKRNPWRRRLETLMKRTIQTIIIFACIISTSANAYLFSTRNRSALQEIGVPAAYTAATLLALYGSYKLDKMRETMIVEETVKRTLEAYQSPEATTKKIETLKYCSHGLMALSGALGVVSIVDWAFADLSKLKIFKK